MGECILKKGWLKNPDLWFKMKWELVNWPRQKKPNNFFGHSNYSQATLRLSLHCCLNITKNENTELYKMPFKAHNYNYSITLLFKIMLKGLKLKKDRETLNFLKHDNKDEMPYDQCSICFHYKTNFRKYITYNFIDP